MEHFVAYTYLVVCEMRRRGYRCDVNKFTKYFNCWSNFKIYYGNIFRRWHNRRYFDQCYYNLQEKYDCGGISDEEWRKIQVVARFKH